MDNLLENVCKAMRDFPFRIMGHHFSQIAVVTNMIAAAGLIDIGVTLLLAGAAFGHLEGFEDRAGVIFTAAEIVDLSTARCLVKLEHEAGNIAGMDVVTNLFAFVAV